VHGCTIAVVDPAAPVGLDDLDRHARPPCASAVDGVGRRNLHDLIGSAVRGLMMAFASDAKVAMLFCLSCRGSSKWRRDDRSKHCVTACIEGCPVFFAR
jgi:hypothetical protein